MFYSTPFPSKQKNFMGIFEAKPHLHRQKLNPGFWWVHRAAPWGKRWTLELQRNWPQSWVLRFQAWKPLAWLSFRALVLCKRLWSSLPLPLRIAIREKQARVCSISGPSQDSRAPVVALLPCSCLYTPVPNYFWVTQSAVCSKFNVVPCSLLVLYSKTVRQYRALVLRLSVPTYGIAAKHTRNWLVSLSD